MLIASESESGHFMRKCISWNGYEKKYIFRARNTVDTWRAKCLQRTILGGKHGANADGIGFDGKIIKDVPRAWRTGRQYIAGVVPAERG
jgi:hypothetical protein